MKTNFLFLFIFIHNVLLSQDYGIGSVVEYDQQLSVELEVYETPKRFNKVEKQSKINYSKIGGLLQSYLSASNMDWMKSEYLNEASLSTVRDEEHFTAVKNSSINDYAQLECVYKFNYNGRKMAYVRYSFIFEKVPFPFVGILSMEKVGNKWYLSNLLNQGGIYYLLKNFENSFIVDILNNIDSNNKDIKNIEDNSKNNDNKISLTKLYKNLTNLRKNNESLYNSIHDQRMIYEDTPFRNADFNSKPKKYKFKNIYHPFVYDNVQLEEYPKKYKGIIANEKTLKDFEGKPEKQLLSANPINLITKISVTSLEETYYFILFEEESGLKKIVELKETTAGNFKVNNTESMNMFSVLLKLIKPSFLKDIFAREIDEEILSKINTANGGGINIDLLYEYIINNKSSLSKYLEE